MKGANDMHWNKLKTPLGTLILVWAGKGLMAAGFEEALNFFFL